MQLRRLGHDWQKAIWKLVRNPAVEVVAAIVAVLLAAWVVIQTEMEHPRQHNPFPVPVHMR
ncbi:MAG TPA: hypothetical protein VFE23_17545 [Usitatibacter sp.]|jgi:hypothetical protein|nr:hypothetical protein [Usitatibacter sp.]